MHFFRAALLALFLLAPGGGQVTIGSITEYCAWISFVNQTQVTVSFYDTWSSVPACAVSPDSPLGHADFWVTDDVNAVTIHTDTRVTTTFTVLCMGQH